VGGGLVDGLTEGPPSLGATARRAEDEDDKVDDKLEQEEGSCRDADRGIES
jgi:hypothetical protein